MNPDTPTLSPDAGSFRHVLRLATPLVLASSGHAIRLMADRIMLARYSQDAIAASFPAGLAAFVMMCFFFGTAGYVNTFIAQYAGADQHRRTGLAVWQGIYISLVGGLLISLLSGIGPSLFRWMGHTTSVQALQVRYFEILCHFSFTGIKEIPDFAEKLV